MFTKADPLWYFKVRYSIKSATGTNFNHRDIDKLPSLSYRFDEGDNWKATDYRVATRLEDVSKWIKTYWESRTSPNNFVVNRVLYEKELQQAIISAIYELNERWTVKLERELEEAFDDKFLGFLSGESQKT